MNKYLICTLCNQQLHLGQDNYIYLGERKVMENLTLFLVKHQGHNLIYSYRLLDYADFENLNYEEKLNG